MYCRIKLSQTNYKEIPYKVLDDSWFEQILVIYKVYTDVKGFDSIWPIFLEELTSPMTDLLGYFDSTDTLQAFSLIYKYPSQSACLADLFSWTYHDPRTRLGYKSIRSECARYKQLGYDYLYLGETAPYKQQLQGFELI